MCERERESESQREREKERKRERDVASQMTSRISVFKGTFKMMKRQGRVKKGKKEEDEASLLFQS